MKICGIYKITNTISNDFYIGSSKNVKHRLTAHKCPSTWKRYKNNPMYLDMQKYGLDNFEFQVIAEVEIDKLKETEQQFIETLKPAYNNYNAKGWNIERRKETNRKAQNKYNKTDKGKESHKKAHKKYEKTDKGKESQRKAVNKYNNQLCLYNGQTLTLGALRERFRRKGIDHPVIEAKKYLIGGKNE